LHGWRHVDRRHDDVGMDGLKNPEDFVGKSLADLVDAVEIQDDMLEAFETLDKEFGLGAGNQLFAFVDGRMCIRRVDQMPTPPAARSGLQPLPCRNSVGRR
jgi:hypothetical protein